MQGKVVQEEIVRYYFLFAYFAIIDRIRDRPLSSIFDESVGQIPKKWSTEKYGGEMCWRKYCL